MGFLLFFLIAGVLIILFLWLTYNGLVTGKVRVDQSWRDIDVQLKRRYDLLPDLVETAKKATALDESVLTEVTRLRSAGMQALNEGASIAQRSQIEGRLSSAMRDIKVQVESYPDIKSHAELEKLMDEVSDIEAKIAYARQFYNSNAADYNTRVQVFPAVLIANSLGFKPAEYFAATEEEKKDVKVAF